MAFLVFALTLAWVPWFWEPGQASRWFLLSACLPLMFMVAPVANTAANRLLACWLGFAALSLLWATSFWDGANALWKLALFGMAFILVQSLTPGQWTRVLLAFCLGMAINAVILFTQHAGLVFVPGIDSNPAALFANKNYLGEALAVAFAVALFRKWWALAFLLAVALALPVAKGALAAVALMALWWVWGRSRWAAVTLALLAVNGVILWSLQHPLPESLVQRFSMWSDTLNALVPLGHGIGSFWTAYPAFQATAPMDLWNFGTGPDNPHSDLVSLLSDLGAGAVFPLLLALLAYRGAGHVERAALVVFLGCGLSGFPLLNPVTGFMAACLAGRACRPRPGVRHQWDRSGADLQSWRDLGKSLGNDFGGAGRGWAFPFVQPDSGGRAVHRVAVAGRAACDGPGSGQAGAKGCAE